MKTLLATLAALVAFAANSLLARAALDGSWIDPVSFTGIRLAGGAVALVLIGVVTGRSKPFVSGGSWFSAAALFVYAIAFSWAYLTLAAGTGALILFGAVQVTMIGFGLWAGERPGLVQWLGLGSAIGGLVYLLLPGLSAPDPAGAALMAGAGVAWGIYSLRGRSDRDAVSTTSGNFVRSLPMAAVATVLLVGSLEVSAPGVLLALISGAITSGLGYVIWYIALRGLSATLGAIGQLAVPPLAALGGIVLLGELFSTRLSLAGVLILGGVALASLAPAHGPSYSAQK